MSDSELIGEPEEVAKRNLAVKKGQMAQDAAMAAIMQHPETRAWMYQLLTLCGMYQSSFDRSALSMAFNEGARNVGLRVTADIMRVCPDNYTAMVREAKVEKNG